jgi:uncharacterized glyoxalase superfamily protein PhnB
MAIDEAKISSSVIPCLRYRDARAAISWLCEQFGFQAHLVVDGENGAVAHAQLVNGSGMIMLGSSSNENDYGKLVVQPDEINGAQTQTIYLVVADPDAVYARVKAVGAQIIIEIADADYGGRGFTCRDLEAHVWSIGSYDPWHQ